MLQDIIKYDEVYKNVLRLLDVTILIENRHLIKLTS